MKISNHKYLLVSALVMASCAPSTSSENHSKVEESVERPVAAERKWTAKIAKPQLGDQWIYSVKTEYQEGSFSVRDGKLVENIEPVEFTQVVEVTEVEPEVAGAAFRFATTNTEDGKLVSKDKFALVDDMLVIVSVQPSVDDGGLGEEVIVFNPGYTLVPSELEAGYSWSESHALGSVPMIDAMTVMREEKITVPAGEFNAWLIRRNRSLGASQSTTFKEDYWFAPRVGIVKIEVERFEAGKRLWHRVNSLREKRLADKSE